jgi:hypothetical protein
MHRTPYKTKHRTRFTLREMFAIYLKPYKPVIKCKSVADWKYERQFARHSASKPHRSAVGLIRAINNKPNIFKGAYTRAEFD